MSRRKEIEHVIAELRDELSLGSLLADYMAHEEQDDIEDRLNALERKMD